MSLSAPFIPVAFKYALDKTEPYWDYLVGNESEALAWAQSHGLEVALYLGSQEAVQLQLKLVLT
jgi:hypothetical protein